MPVGVEVVAGGVEVPGADARRAAADLAELQSLGPEEPLHVRRARADAERVVDPLAELAQLLVVGDRVEAVGRDELRRDPPHPHRLEHVREVVRDEVDGGVAVDRQRVVEALVPLDELLDGDGLHLLRPEHPERGGELGVVVDTGGVEGAGT